MITVHFNIKLLPIWFYSTTPFHQRRNIFTVRPKTVIIIVNPKIGNHSNFFLFSEKDHTKSFHIEKWECFNAENEKSRLRVNKRVQGFRGGGTKRSVERKGRWNVKDGRPEYALPRQPWPCFYFWKQFLHDFHNILFDS